VSGKVKAISRLFVGLPAFERAWKQYGLTDETRRSLELALLENPKAGVLIPDTNGVRKIRHGVPGRGKSGGIRVFYYDFDSLGRIYLLAVIQKGDQENLNKEQRNELGAMIAAMKRGLK
jgi:hypothetical protein